MFKFVTIYRRVDDEMALEEFFSQRHLPFAEQLPGLVRTEVSRIVGKPGGESRFHLMYELYFPSREVFESAFMSEVGQELFLALKEWYEAKIINWFYAESWEEQAVDRRSRGL